MKIKSVHIHNFRAILDRKIALKNYTLLVGPNNSGKSSFFDAIRAFYEEGGFKFKEDRDFPKLETDKESYIEVEFSDISDADIEKLKNMCKAASVEGIKNGLRVRRYFKLDSYKSNKIYLVKDDNSLSELCGSSEIKKGIFGNPIYIPANTQVDEHTKLSGPSVLKNLLQAILQDIISQGEAYKKFAESVEEFAEAIQKEETNDRRSLNDLKEKLNKMLKQWRVEFDLKFKIPTEQDIIKTMINFELIDNALDESPSFDMDQIGSGLQRYFIYSLIRTASEYRESGNSLSPTLNLILFEEPEVFLHPPYQDQLILNLKRLAMNDGNGTNWQVICSTHSPRFVSSKIEEISSIVRMKRSKRGEITVFQISDSELKEIFKNEKSDKDYSDVEPVIYINSDRAGAFFADHVLLVEGHTEMTFIRRLVEDGKIRVPIGFHVMDCLGKFNIPKFMTLLSKFGIFHSVLHDVDNKEKHAEYNNRIKNAYNPNYTVNIKSIEKNLETFLGIEGKLKSYDKPKAVYQAYIRGEIDKQRLKEFCKIVEECLNHPKKTSQEQ